MNVNIFGLIILILGAVFGYFSQFISEKVIKRNNIKGIHLKILGLILAIIGSIIIFIS